MKGSSAPMLRGACSKAEVKSGEMYGWGGISMVMFVSDAAALRPLVRQLVPRDKTRIFSNCGVIRSWLN